MAKYSFSLHNRTPVAGQTANKIFAQMCEAGIAQGNCWAYWNCREQVGRVEIRMAAISVAFTLEDLSFDEFSTVIRIAAASPAKHESQLSSDIYQRMLDATKQSQEEA